MKNLSIVVALLLFLACSGVSAAEKIDINAASLNDLVKIIHIGEKRALEMISLRPFSSLDDLARIKGIGLVRIEDIRKQGLACLESFPEGVTELPEIKGSTTEAETEAETASLATTDETSPSRGTDKPLRIDINNASAQELQILIGVGTVLAQRIVDVRPFYTLGDLTKVNGIGAGTLESIKDQGLAWVDPNLAPPKTEKVEIFDKNSAAAPIFLRQDRGKKSPEILSVFLIASVLAAFSGIIILTLKRKLKPFS